MFRKPERCPCCGSPIQSVSKGVVNKIADARRELLNTSRRMTKLEMDIVIQLNSILEAIDYWGGRK